MAHTEVIRGIGHSVRRVEDDRFIRGAGNYIDDIHLPGMLHMAILRSPYAHANLKSVDGSRAQALDGVIAVDAIGLQALVAGTGPVVVGDRTITAKEVPSYVLHDQYEEFANADAVSSLGVDNAARMEAIGALAERIKTNL